MREVPQSRNTRATFRIGGNRIAVPSDYSDVDLSCEQCREALSARLDGEDLPHESAAVERHLDMCEECRLFEDDAARITRLTRTGPADPGPDLVDVLLVAAPDPPKVTVLGTIRALLVMVAVGQMSLALGGLLSANSSHGGQGEVGGATISHLTHESSAWNLALAAAFLWVALQAHHRTAGLVPLLGAFVGVLTLLSAVDLFAGRVDGTRVLSHGLIVAGLILVLMIDRRRPFGGSTPDSLDWRRFQRFAAGGPAEPHWDVDDPDDDGRHLRPTAMHLVA